MRHSLQIDWINLFEKISVLQATNEWNNRRLRENAEAISVATNSVAVEIYSNFNVSGHWAVDWDGHAISTMRSIRIPAGLIFNRIVALDCHFTILKISPNKIPSDFKWQASVASRCRRRLTNKQITGTGWSIFVDIRDTGSSGDDLQDAEQDKYETRTHTKKNVRVAILRRMAIATAAVVLISPPFLQDTHAHAGQKSFIWLLLRALRFVPFFKNFWKMLGNDWKFQM